MVVIENIKVKDIPILHVVKKGIIHCKTPLVIFAHGFTSAKEHNLHYAYLLAEKGFRVLLPEALYHGERDMHVSAEEVTKNFWEIVLKSIHELEIIKTEFEQKGLIDVENIGLAGTSMGGITTLGAMTQYSWIKAAVSLMGMPSYESFALWQIEEIKKKGGEVPLNEEEISSLLDKLKEHDLCNQPEVLSNRPLMFWHGKQDNVVPYNFAYDFYKKIKSKYKKVPEKLVFLSDENAAHAVTREGVLKTVQWFETYLNK